MSVAGNAPPDVVTNAIEELWRLPPPGPANLFSSPQFVQLKEALQSLHPNVGKPVFALGTALRSLGLPCGLSQDRQHLSLTPHEAARRLDLAARAKRARRWHMPSPESLSWEPQALTDAWGDIVEIERPVVLPLEDEAAAAVPDWNGPNFERITQARASPLFETPVAHFFVRAYLSDGVDEVLGHLTAIEAALGLQADYDRRLRLRSDKGPGATKRVAARVAALLGARSFSDQYEQLFKVRSAFLHGRAMGAISTAERVVARKLSRQVITALVDQAAAGHGASREAELQRLLDRGLPFL